MKYKIWRFYFSNTTDKIITSKYLQMKKIKKEKITLKLFNNINIR